MQSNKVVNHVQVMLETIAKGLFSFVKGVTRPFTHMPSLLLSVIPVALVFVLLALFEVLVGDLVQARWFDSQMQFEAWLDGAGFVFAMFLAAHAIIALVGAFLFSNVWAGDRNERKDQ